MTTEAPDWFEKGREHFQNLADHGKSSVEYPTQDAHTPTDEADFVRGFNKARHERLGTSLAAYHADDLEGC